MKEGLLGGKLRLSSRSQTHRRSRVSRRWHARPTRSTRRFLRCSATATLRLYLVKHKSALKNRIHSTLINFGKPCPVTDLFGVEGRQLLKRLEVPEPWRGNITASIELIDDLEGQIAQINRRLKEGHAEHPYVPLLLTVPGIGWVLAFTIAAEIGEIERFSSPEKLTGYTGLCPRVKQSGEKDRRGPLTKHGPTYLRWALLEATMHALRHPAYSERLSGPSAGSESSAVPRSPRSTSLEGSPTRSGTCFPARRSSLPEAPRFVWRPDRPFRTCARANIQFRLILPTRRP